MAVEVTLTMMSSSRSSLEDNALTVTDEVKSVLTSTVDKTNATGAKLAEETAQALVSAVEGAGVVTEKIEQISRSSDDQATSITQVTQGIDEISSVVQTNSATAEESAVASEALSGLAQALKNLVSRFHLANAGENSMQSAEQQNSLPEAIPAQAIQAKILTAFPQTAIGIEEKAPNHKTSVSGLVFCNQEKRFALSAEQHEKGMIQMKILHTADIHLGDLAGPIKDGENLRRLDTLGCMNFIVKTAIEETPNLTIIAGDLFNRSRVWADTALEDVNDAVTRFLRPLCKASDAVVLLFGTENHDNPKAFKTISEITRYEKNLFIYTSPTVETVETGAGPVQILALPGIDRGRLRLFRPEAGKEQENRSFTTLVNETLLSLSKRIDPSVPSVLTAHYTVSGCQADNGSTFMAGQDIIVFPETIDAAGVSLACFGHIHRPQRLCSKTPAFYCGSPNQLNFNDEGIKHGFYIHTLPASPKEDPIPRFFPTPERRHYTFHMGSEDVDTFITSGTLRQIPDGLPGSIVRVRYTCPSEQEKAFNRAQVQKELLGAGAFYVAEVLPQLAEEPESSNLLTEHGSPAESLARWFAQSGVTASDAARLFSLAAPLFKGADDGRGDSKHSGAFTPLSIKVKNYRSYTDACFDFELVHMAMVNGPNGVGKSSLFMDAIADCLYEQTRKEDLGGWVRDSAKSGSIAFTFQMGGQRYRVIRTRTRAGRGTLALHRFDSGADDWEDESDTAMRLTQQRIERLLLMDYNTFCSVALIRQDAYGLFLEADSDRRMEVLSALLGLDIYSRLEQAAKLCAAEQRRSLNTIQERLNILAEHSSLKAELKAQDKTLCEKAIRLKREIKEKEAALSAAAQAESMRLELLKQADEKGAQAREYRRKAIAKEEAARQTESRLQMARAHAASLPDAQKAADDVTNARLVLESIAPAEETLRSLTQELIMARRDAQEAARRLLELEESRKASESVTAQKAQIEAAQKVVSILAPQKEEAQRRALESDKAAEAVKACKEARDAFHAESRVHLGALGLELKQALEQAARLTESGCPAPNNATCKFLAAAAAAKKAVPALKKQLASISAADKLQFQKLDCQYKKALQAKEALGDPAADLMLLSEKERQYLPLVSLAPRLAAAEAKLEEIAAAASIAQKAKEQAEARISAILGQLPPLEEKHTRAEAAKKEISENAALASTLSICLTADATLRALAPQAEELRREAKEFLSMQQSALLEEAALRERIPPQAGDTGALQAQLDALRKALTDTATQRGVIQAKLEQTAEAESQSAALRKESARTASALDDFTALSQAFGLDGVQHMIIKGVVPEITRRTNEILASMTGGRMAVEIRTERVQRSTKQIANSLEVWISGAAGSIRPYQSHSGGEKVKIALAVTLALADVKARRAGVQLGMLFIDEPPFLDADGTEAYADALDSMAARNPEMRILAISHDPMMKARFPQNITVAAGEYGSMVTVN